MPGKKETYLKLMPGLGDKRACLNFKIIPNDWIAGLENKNKKFFDKMNKTTSIISTLCFSFLYIPRKNSLLMRHTSKV